MKRLSCMLTAVLGGALASAGHAVTLPHPATGYRVEVFAPDVPSAREMTLGPSGTIFVGSMNAGNVYAITYDPLHPDHAARVRVVAHDLDMPVGVAFHNGTLYVADVARILVLPNIMSSLDASPQPRELVKDLPWRAGDHDWKFIAFGPDDKLYVPIGAPCNICSVGHDFGKILRMDADGGHRQDIAFGIRNSVGFDWQPDTRKLWFTDNGCDNLGDDIPSDELNRLDHKGQEFGYPYCHQGDIADPVFGKGHPCANYTPPVAKLGAHVAALGMRFYRMGDWPGLHDGIIVAEHGSWNRRTPSGYRVVGISRDMNQQVLLDFRDADGHVLGRPADVQPLPDGSVLVSDDRQGAIFRLLRDKP